MNYYLIISVITIIQLNQLLKGNNVKIKQNRITKHYNSYEHDIFIKREKPNKN